MDIDTELRQKIKILKAIGQIDNYYEVAEILEMQPKSFYNWLRGEYKLGREKIKRVKDLVADLWLPLE